MNWQWRRPARGSTIAAAIAGGLLVCCAALTAHVAWSNHAARIQRAASHSLAEALGLTDIALFTEARYTRHLSLADLHSPFQDAPMAFEHFPAGALTVPPRHLPASRFDTREAAE